jgi:type III restriction enzyme
MDRYKNLHQWMIIPMLLMQLGIYRDYWGDFSDNAWSVHIHYWTGTIWYVYLIIQPYFATHGQLSKHRTNGIIGMFLAGGVGVTALSMLYRDLDNAHDAAAFAEQFGPFKPWFFYGVAADEIERYRREIIQRTGDQRQAENISDQDLLREVMNTVGKPGRLGESIRCVVSVSMLTEGWDANTVTHILGIRAFGTQLLCEQVVGRALRRQSYELNDDHLFDVEYADILGIPFDFTAKPVIAKPQTPRETVHVRAVRPERDSLGISFPRVEGYRVELPEERLRATFNQDSTLMLTPDLVGPSITKNAGIIGEDIDLSLKHTEDMRPSTLLFHLTKRLLYTRYRDPDSEPELHLFNPLKRVVKEWLNAYLVCKGGTYPAQLMYQELADMACSKIHIGITRYFEETQPIRAVLDSYNPVGSSLHVNFYTAKKSRWQTDSRRCHINWVVLDSDWEAEFCRVVESHPRVKGYVKNQGLGFEVPYRYGSNMRKYLPDFIVQVDDGRADLLNLVVEVKGYRGEDAKEKKATMDTYWIPGVNNLGAHGRWAFVELKDVFTMQAEFEKCIEKCLAP